jgi:quinol monooxygenase YgiN
VFRFAPDRIEAAIAAFRTMRDASRSHPGNISYDVFRSSEDAGSFFIVERWSSQAALDAHEQTPVFISVGQKVLTATAELHDSVTGVALSP